MLPLFVHRLVYLLMDGINASIARVPCSFYFFIFYILLFHLYHCGGISIFTLCYVYQNASDSRVSERPIASRIFCCVTHTTSLKYRSNLLCYIPFILYLLKFIKSFVFAILGHWFVTLAALIFHASVISFILFSSDTCSNFLPSGL